MVVKPRDRSLDGGVPADAVLQVDHDDGGVARGEGVTVEADAGGGRQFHVDAVPVEPGGVVAGSGAFVRAAEVGPGAGEGIAGLPAGDGHVAGERHEGDVAEVADACSAEVGVGEAGDGGVGEVVARRPVPRPGDARGTELREAEGDVGAHEDVTVTAGADVRVNVARVAGLSRAGSRQQGQYRELAGVIVACFHGMIAWLV